VPGGLHRHPAAGPGGVPDGGVDGTVLLSTHRMTGIAIDPLNCTARVEAGVRCAR
jgi:FAD/FMN-containing dehydrogenase